MYLIMISSKQNCNNKYYGEKRRATKNIRKCIIIYISRIYIFHYLISQNINFLIRFD